MGESFTIQISSNLVKQLADEGEKPKRKIRKPKPKISQDIHPKLQKRQILDDSETLKGPASTGWPIQPPLFLSVPPPQHSASVELDAIQSILQESEKVVERLQKREDEMQKEVTQRAKDLHDREFKLPSQKPMPCLAEKDACWKCYKEHVKDPLKCAPVVQSFADCARRTRQQKIAADN